MLSDFRSLLVIMAMGSGGLAFATQTLTVEDVADANLIENGTFADGAISSFKGWNFYPDGTSLIQAISGDPGYAVEMKSGGAVLALHSIKIPVRQNTAYTLVYDTKQEDIHIGFEMGGAPTIRWFEKPDGSPKALLFPALDGSFEWRTVSHSFTSPPGTQYIQISLGKRGMPGNVFYRNIRFAEGVLKRTHEELKEEDYISDQIAYLHFKKRLEAFHAEKGGLSNSDLSEERKTIGRLAKEGAIKVASEAAQRGFVKADAKVHNVTWAEMLKGAQGFQVTPDSPHYEEWKALSDRFEAYKAQWLGWHVKTNPERIRQAMKEEFGGERPYGVGVSTSMFKVGRDVPYAGAIQRNARLSLARQEEENLQLTLIASERKLGKLRVEIMPPKDASGMALDAKLSIYRIDQVKTSSPQYAVDRVGYWPDIVYPANEVQEVGHGSNQSFWINVASHGETVAGRYNGAIRVFEEERLLEELPLEVTIWDITLPKPGRFKVVGRFSPNQLQEFYQWKKLDGKVVADWNRYIYSKRWNSTDPFATGLTPNDEGLKAAVSEGINAVNLVNISQLLKQDRPSRTYEWPDAEMEKLIKERLLAMNERFEAIAGKDHPAQRYVFGFDEQHDRSQYPLMKHVFNIAKETLPGVKTITTTTYSPLDTLVGSVDAWVPLLGSETPDVVARGAAGDERWFYIYGHPFHPYPNASLVDYPGVEGRVTFWLASRLGYSGFLHWLMNGWFANTKDEKRWPEADWNIFHLSRNGEGNFLYPGPEGQPISSVRFEIIRDGIEDWELLDLLRSRIASAPASKAKEVAIAVLAKAEALTPDATQYCSNDQELMAMREEVAHALLELK